MGRKDSNNNQKCPTSLMEFNSLPLEALGSVLQFLDVRSLQYLSLVCRSLWKLVPEIPQRLEDSVVFSRDLRFFPNVKHVRGEVWLTWDPEVGLQEIEKLQSTSCLQISGELDENSLGTILLFQRTRGFPIRTEWGSYFYAPPVLHISLHPEFRVFPLPQLSFDTLELECRKESPLPLGLDTQKIRELRIGVTPKFLDSKWFPSLTTLRFQLPTQEEELDRIVRNGTTVRRVGVPFSGPVPQITHISGACIYSSRVWFRYSLEDELWDFERRYPNLRTGDLTIFLMHYDDMSPEFIESRELEGDVDTEEDYKEQVEKFSQRHPDLGTRLVFWNVKEYPNLCSRRRE